MKLTQDSVKSFSQLSVTVKTITKLNLGHNDTFEIIIEKSSFCGSNSPGKPEFCQRTAKNVSRIITHVHCQPLFCSLTFSFSNVPVAIVVFLNFLLSNRVENKLNFSDAVIHQPENHSCQPLIYEYISLTEKFTIMTGLVSTRQTFFVC